jgi:hypothetical protein
LNRLLPESAADAAFAGVGPSMRVVRSRSDRSRHAAALAAADFDREWRRRESNPRPRTASDESPEDPDLATPGAAQSAPKPRHKHKAAGSEELPFIHPGQLTVFDLLGDG